MKQYEAVEIITNKIIETNLSEAIMLKGSIARGHEDQFSNVNIHVLVNESNIDKFLLKRIFYLSSYHPIMHSSFERNQVICIYENGVRVNLFTTLIKELNTYDDITIIYDPNNILAKYHKTPLAYTPVEIGSLIDLFCIISLDFYKAYRRNDIIYSLRLASDMSVNVGTFMRVMFEPSFAKLGIKQFFNNNDFDNKNKYMEIIKKLRAESVLESVKRMHILMDDYINNIPLLIAEHVNFDFYNFAKKKIMSIV